MTPELKELLTLAAKAAGYDTKYFEKSDEYRHLRAAAWLPWEPHDHDGDALCLARDAELVIDFSTRLVWAWKGEGAAARHCWTKGDHAGMCMAIIRAAAEKGRAM